MTIGFVLLALFVPSMCAQEQGANVRIEPHSVVARGKWKATTGKAGDELAFRHIVEIHCFESEGLCMEATASVVGKEPDLAVEYYKVLHWDENGLVAQNDDAICMTNQLLINFQEKSVLAVDAPKRGAQGPQAACKTLGHSQTYKLVAR
jgi:hypothetical protein